MIFIQAMFQNAVHFTLIVKWYSTIALFWTILVYITAVYAALIQLLDVIQYWLLWLNQKGYNGAAKTFISLGSMRTNNNNPAVLADWCLFDAIGILMNRVRIWNRWACVCVALSIERLTKSDPSIDCHWDHDVINSMLIFSFHLKQLNFYWTKSPEASSY